MTRTKTNRIIIHHSLSNDVSSKVIDLWHKLRGWIGIGYHVVIRVDGSLEHGRNFHKVGAHAFKRNGDSIGVCVVGNFNNSKPTDEQYDTLVAYVKSARVLFGQHLAVEYHHKGCPAKGFDREYFEERLLNEEG